MGTFSHLNKKNEPRMVDIGEKTVTSREAVAECYIRLGGEVLSQLSNDELNLPKGPVFQTAIIAGTLAVKKTSSLIPLCHTLNVEHCSFTIKQKDPERIHLQCTVRTSHKTGVEMEALTGAGIAALTIYDMCKSFSHEITIESLQLVSKSGGKSRFVRKT